MTPKIPSWGLLAALAWMSGSLALPAAGASSEALVLATVGRKAFFHPQDPGSEGVVAAAIDSCLAADPVVQRIGGWTVGWGPALLAPVEGSPGLVLFAVEGSLEGSDTRALVVSETRPFFDSGTYYESGRLDRVPWPFGSPSGELGEAVLDETVRLTQVESDRPGPGSPIDVLEYVTTEVLQSPNVRILVTGLGHGGTLASPLALYLFENQHVWNPNGSATLAVETFGAEATADEDLADYYGVRLGSLTARAWNDLDPMPLLVDEDSAADFEALYAPSIPIDPETAARTEALSATLAGATLFHPGPASPGLAGTIVAPEALPFDPFLPSPSGALSDWQRQAHHQGTLAYLDLFDAEEVLECFEFFDFGDAPDPLDATPGVYPTLLVNDGARHALSAGPFLGGCADAETDGQPTAAADGDDGASGSPVVGACRVAGDDEDGVVFTSALIQGGPATVEVAASDVGSLDAWIDWNADGDWDDAGEQVFADEPVDAGANPLGFTVPAGATPGATYARFRLSSAGGLAPTGLATDGEVEDYAVTVLDADTFRSDVVGTKEVSGELVDGSTVVYTIVLTNLGPGLQQDNPEDEFIDVLPAELELVAAAADSGAATADPDTDTVTWNGAIPAGDSVTIVIDAKIPEDTPLDTAIENQGTIRYDADGFTSNEATRPTDDPATADPEDPTVFLVLPASVLEIPTLGQWALWLLALLLAAGGAVALRR